MNQNVLSVVLAVVATFIQMSAASVANTITAVSVTENSVDSTGSSFTTTSLAIDGSNFTINPAGVEAYPGEADGASNINNASDGFYLGGFTGNFFVGADRSWYAYKDNVWFTSTALELGGSLGDDPWFSTNLPNPRLLFDLGSVKTINGISINNNGFQGGGTGNASKELKVWHDTAVPGPTSPAMANIFLDNLGNEVVQSIGFAPVSARYFQFEIIDNWDGNRAGLADVQFSLVPEPTGIVLVSLAGLGWAMGRPGRYQI